MKHFRILLCFLLVGCGFVPSESKLVGTWQIDVLPARKVFYVFRQDHTYAVITSGRPGSLEGTWKLDGNILTTTMGSVTVYGMTNALPPVPAPGLSSTQKVAIRRLTDSAMTWGLRGPGVKFKRVKTPPPAGASPS